MKSTDQTQSGDLTLRDLQHLSETYNQDFKITRVPGLVKVEEL